MSYKQLSDRAGSTNQMPEDTGTGAFLLDKMEVDFPSLQKASFRDHKSMLEE